ncbi:hypothetical protein HanRHA438_Chr10g0478111 [Helianthus annuus]|nr:hypothetical protein HanRHA438_Chr10g0478111 [Helianthus annuus]
MVNRAGLGNRLCLRYTVIVSHHDVEELMKFASLSEHTMKP